MKIFCLILGDGNCMLYALQDQLIRVGSIKSGSSKKLDASALREKLVDVLESEADRLVDQRVVGVAFSDDFPLQKLEELVSEAGTLFASEIEKCRMDYHSFPIDSLWSAATALKLNIRVWALVGGIGITERLYTPATFSATAELWLGHYPGHFVSVVDASATNTISVEQRLQRVEAAREQRAEQLERERKRAEQAERQRAPQTEGELLEALEGRKDKNRMLQKTATGKRPSALRK